MWRSQIPCRCSHSWPKNGSWSNTVLLPWQLTVLHIWMMLQRCYRKLDMDSLQSCSQSAPAPIQYLIKSEIWSQSPLLFHSSVQKKNVFAAHFDDMVIITFHHCKQNHMIILYFQTFVWNVATVDLWPPNSIQSILNSKWAKVIKTIDTLILLSIPWVDIYIC